MDYNWETPDPSKATNLPDYLRWAGGRAYGRELDHDDFVEARLLNEDLGISVQPMPTNQNWYHITHEGKILGSVQVITDDLGTQICPLRINEVAIPKLEASTLLSPNDDSWTLREVNSDIRTTRQRANETVRTVGTHQIQEEFDNCFLRGMTVHFKGETFQSTVRRSDTPERIEEEYTRFIELLNQHSLDENDQEAVFKYLYQYMGGRFTPLLAQIQTKHPGTAPVPIDQAGGDSYEIFHDKEGQLHFKAVCQYRLKKLKKKQKTVGYFHISSDWNTKTNEVVTFISPVQKEDPRKELESWDLVDKRLRHKELAKRSFPKYNVEEVWEGDNSAYRLYKNGKVFGTTRYSTGEDEIPTLTVHKIDHNSPLRKVAFAVAGLLLLGSLNLFAAYVPSARFVARAADITSGSLVTLLFVRTLLLRRPRIALTLDGSEGNLKANSPHTANTYTEYLKRAQHSINFDTEYTPTAELVGLNVREVENTPPIPTILDNEFRSGNYAAWIHTADGKKPVLFQPPASQPLGNGSGGSADKPYRYLFETLQRHYPSIDLELALSKLNQNLLREGAKMAEMAFTHKPFGIELGPLEGIEYEVLSEDSFRATAYRKVIQRKRKKQAVVGYVRIEASSSDNQVHSEISSLLPNKPISKERNEIHKTKWVNQLFVSALDDRFSNHNLPEKLQVLNRPATWKKDLSTHAGREAYRKKLKGFKGVEILEDRAAWLGLSTARFNEKSKDTYGGIQIPANVATDLNRSHFTFAPHQNAVSSSLFGQPLHRAPKNGEKGGESLIESINDAYRDDQAGIDALISATCQATGVLPTIVAFALFGNPAADGQMVNPSIAAEYDLFQTEETGDHVASARIRYKLWAINVPDDAPLGFVDVRTVSCARTGKRITIVSDVRESEEAFEPRNSVTLTDYLDRLAPGAFVKKELVEDGTDLQQDLEERIKERYANERLGIHPVIKSTYNDGPYQSVRIELIDQKGKVVGNTVIEQRYDAETNTQNITYHPTRSERLIPPELLN